MVELTATSHLRIPSLSPISQTISINNNNNTFFNGHFRHAHYLKFPIGSFFSFPYYIPKCSSINVTAKKRNSQPEPILKPSIVQEVSMKDDDEDGILLDEFEDEEIEDGDDFEDEYLEEDAETLAGDGAGGGGISLAGTSWDKEALAIAEEVSLSFDGDLGIYAFKTTLNFAIRIRIEKLSNNSGSPSMMDIEAFSLAYRARLDEAEAAGSIPKNYSLEVSSPGVERVVRVPQDLGRFKDRPMCVKYMTKVDETASSSESDGVFRLVSFDLETSSCIWGLADVRINREKAGKGRPLNKKQREWRLNTPFDSLRLVRFYSEI